MLLVMGDTSGFIVVGSVGAEIMGVARPGVVGGNGLEVMVLVGPELVGSFGPEVLGSVR